MFLFIQIKLYIKYSDKAVYFHLVLLLLLTCSAAKSLQLCLILCDPIDSSPPGFSRQEHWSGLPFPSPLRESEKWKWSRSVLSDSATPWTAAHQAPPSMGFSRQEYWSGLPLPYLLSCAQLFAVPWTVACQAPMYMEFSRQEYCSHFLFQGIFLTQGSNQCPCISCIDRQILYH